MSWVGEAPSKTPVLAYEVLLSLMLQEPEMLMHWFPCREDSYFSGLPISIIESWYQRDGYVKSMADLIEKELSAFSNPEEVPYS
jgi:hypothetical protein